MAFTEPSYPGPAHGPDENGMIDEPDTVPLITLRRLDAKPSDMRTDMIERPGLAPLSRRVDRLGDVERIKPRPDPVQSQ